MNRIYKSILVAALIVLPFAASATASAASTCQVGYTGPDSNNLCTSTTTYACTAINDNTVVIEGANVQVALTGDATGGSSSTGSATNSNGTTFTVAVTNNDCSVVATIPAVVTPTATPPEVVTPQVAAPQQVKAAALPDTSSRSPFVAAGIVAVSIGAGALVVRSAFSLYARMKS